jgi:hypothetical protein
MAAISDSELLAVWEAARGAPPALRPAALLRAASGEAGAERLPVGERDRRLLALRERWFGPMCGGVADCPSCGTAVELAFDTRPMAALPSRQPGDGPRLPDSRDLLAISGCSDAAAARARLASRCLGRESAGAEEIDALSEALSAADPAGDIALNVTCPACATAWEVLFDPGAYFWCELDSAAIEALREVDALAAAYGWSERDVLAMSRERRRIYLGLVLG